MASCSCSLNAQRSTLNAQHLYQRPAELSFPQTPRDLSRPGPLQMLLSSTIRTHSMSMRMQMHMSRTASNAAARALSRAAFSAAPSLDAASCTSAAHPISDYTPYFSSRSMARMPSAIRELQPLLALDGMISLGGGMPNPDTFPFTKITVEVKTGWGMRV